MGIFLALVTFVFYAPSLGHELALEHSFLARHPFASHALRILLHAAIAAGLFLWARSRLSKPFAFLASILFAFNPMVVAAVCGPLFWSVHLVWYFMALPACFISAWVFERLHTFLLGQEKIIRIFFLVGLASLVAGLSAISFSKIGIWKNDISFWSYEIKRKPRAEAFCSLASALQSRPDYKKALEYYKAFRQDKGKIKEDTQALKSVEKIGLLYQKAITAEPQNPLGYYHLADFYNESGNEEMAIETYKKALVVDPRHTQAHLGLGAIYQRQGRDKEAIEIYNALIKAHPDNEDIYIQVMAAYGQAVAKDPDNVLYQEKREEILAEFEQFSKRKQYHAIDYFNLGFLYQQVGGREEAVRFYTKALELKPNLPQALFHLAKIYQDMGNFKAALILYERLVHYHPRYSDGYLNMGIILDALGERQRAKDLYLKAVGVDDNNSKALFHLGYLSESEGELREAINYYEKSIEADPKNAEAYYNLGNVYASLNQNGEAIALYLKTIGINPNHQNAYVNLSILAFKAKDFAGAIRYLEEAQILGYNAPADYLKTLEPYRKK